MGSNGTGWTTTCFGSHLVAALSGVIPPGERFFANTIRRQYAITSTVHFEPGTGTIGQERLHQREHDEFNRVLAQAGLPDRRDRPGEPDHLRPR